MDDVYFMPQVCDEADSTCADLSIVARFLKREEYQNQAAFSMLQTTFIVFLLGAGAMAFSKDTQTLVVAPIEKMVNIVKQLADDPLTKPEVDAAEGEDAEDHIAGRRRAGGKSTGQLETSML